MTIYDDAIFAAGGGSTVKIYTPGMVMKAFEQVRSRRDGQTYTRMSEVPTSLTVNTDPALDIVNFTSDNQTDVIGTVKEFPDIGGDGILKTNGQVWLASGNIITDPMVVNKFADANDKVLKKIGHHCIGYPASQTGIPSSTFVKHIVGDGQGNWLCYDAGKKLYRSADDGITWVLVTTLTATESSFATNGTGTWWRADTDGNVYQSVDIGTTWTLIQRPVATAGTITVNVFKFMEGKLYWMHGTSFVSSNNTTTAITYCYTLPNTTNTSQTWSTLTYQGQEALAGGVSNGSSSAVRDVLVVDGYVAITMTTSMVANRGFNGLFNPTTGLTAFYYNNQICGKTVPLVYDGNKFWFHGGFYDSVNYNSFYSVVTFTKEKNFKHETWSSAAVPVNNVHFSITNDFLETVASSARPGMFFKYGCFFTTYSPMVRFGSNSIPKNTLFKSGSVSFNWGYATGMAGDTIITIDNAGIVGRYTPYIGLVEASNPRFGTTNYLRIA